MLDKMAKILQNKTLFYKLFHLCLYLCACWQDVVAAGNYVCTYMYIIG